MPTIVNPTPRQLILAGIVAAAALGAALLLRRTPPEADQLRVDGGWWTDSTGARFIAGVVSNGTGRDYGHLHIAFELLGADSQVVGQVAASTRGLAAGERWEFRAPVPDTLAVHFRVQGLSSIGGGPEP